MSFWAKSTGVAAEATMEQEGAESGKLVRIPDNTMVQAIITDIEMNKVRDEDFEEDLYEYDGYKFTWNIIEQGEFAGVNVKQALRVMSRKNTQRDQALDVLAFMDLHMNAGAFMAAGEAPDIVDLLEAFQNKPMLVKIRAMAGTNQETGAETYNQWVAGVFRKKPEAFEAHPSKEAAIAAATAKMNKTNGPAAGPKVTGPAAGPKVNGPAAGPKVTGPTPAQIKAKEAAEAARLAAEEAQREADAQAVADEAASVADAMDGVQTDDDTPPLDY
ncbi:hypothetical protein [Pantoea phage Nafs113]|nr:hypothetical protein [Pantoea phage Nafs113]